MDSTLTLREIQDRMRSGSSVEEVAVEAGVDVADLAGYAAPIMAEREYIAELACDSNVRRAGDSPAHRDLEAVVTEELRARGADPQQVVWDAARVERRRWQVLATVQDGQTTRHAVFNFDVDGRYSVAANEDARWMLGELPLPPVDLEAEPTVELTKEQRRARLAAVEGLDDDWGDDEEADPSDLQTLHDMMRNYEETVSGYEDTLSRLRGFGGDRETYGAPAARPGAAGGSETTAAADRTGGSQARPASARTPARRRPGPEPEQPSLVEGEAPAPRKRAPRRRAQVPSWDEIVFGSGSDDQHS